MSLLDALMRVIPFDFAGNQLLVRGKWQAGDGIEMEDDPVTGRTVITATGSVVATSPLTTKGDLYCRSASVDSRLPVGTNGYYLTPDSTQALGVKWAALPTTVTAHTASHATGGSDPLVGATIACALGTPTNYTATGATIAGHHAGLDTALGLRLLKSAAYQTQQYATASATVSDGNAATASALAFTPAGGRYPAVYVNGVRKRVGDLTRACYFSADGGTTAVADGSIVAGNTLRWKGSVAGGQLAGTEEILIEAIAQ